MTNRSHFVFLHLPGAGLAGRCNLSVPEAGALANATPLQDATVFARRARIVASSACSGIFVCRFKTPSSSRHKAQRKSPVSAPGCNTLNGGLVLAGFANQGVLVSPLNCASEREVVPNSLEVVPNESEVVPNGLEVVPGNRRFLHPPKKTNEITGTCHDVTTSSRHISL